MQNPLLALERVASVTGRQLIVETHVDLLHVRRPACAYYPGAELDHNPTNWCGPNPPAVIAMVKSVGFTRVALVFRPSFAYRATRAVNWLVQRRSRFFPTLDQGRIVVQAWR
jgi:tRNA (mo5U34)-methyltransferase